MIKTNTLFILGAGASAPFKYPTSIKLREDILKNQHEPAIIHALNPEDDDSHSFIKLQDDFLNEFMRSSVYSIDSFLEHRNEYMTIGKMNIAANLMIHENDGTLRQTEDNWYMYLYDRLKASFERIKENKISFITFNYDRSLEQFFFEAIRCRFGKKPKECTEIMKSIPIVHLYGQLDFLEWQSSDGKAYSPKDKFIERLRAAPKNIKLINDERGVDKSEDFQRAYGLIKNAERVIFIGFSFDETNLGRLNTSLMKGKSLISTGLGMEPAKYRWVQKHFFDKIGANIAIQQDKDGLSLLRDELHIE